MSRNTTLNMINIEIAELQGKQKVAPLGIIDMKKLESLVKMKKDLSLTKDDVEQDDIDEDIFTDEEILEFLAHRKADEQKRLIKAESKAAKSTVKKKKETNEETEALLFKE